MMLGRRGMDVMKIARILGIAICIQMSSTICSALDVPGNWLESRTQSMAKAANKQVATLERAVATKQQESTRPSMENKNGEYGSQLAASVETYHE